MGFRAAIFAGSASFGSPSGDVAIGNLENEGTSPYVPHADHGHAFPAAVGRSTTSAPGDAAGDGTDTTAARSNHRHGREQNPAWTNPTTANAATAGGGTALPATPTGYVEVAIGAATKKMPYYEL